MVFPIKSSGLVTLNPSRSKMTENNSNVTINDVLDYKLRLGVCKSGGKQKIRCKKTRSSTLRLDAIVLAYKNKA
jgi:hypothetical protein